MKVPDGEEAEFEAQKLGSHTLGRFRVGDKVPVRCLADDHSMVQLDIPALEQKHATEIAKAKAHFEQY